MRILLNEEESEQWLHIKECEKILEETSRFPPDMSTCAACGRGPLGHARVAVNGKIYCCAACAPRKVPAMATKRLPR